MSDVSMRRATVNDLQAIISLLANDPLGAAREDPSVPLRVTYLQAFEAIDADPNQFLAVATLDDTVVGTLQLTFIPTCREWGPGELRSKLFVCTNACEIRDWAVDFLNGPLNRAGCVAVCWYS